MRKRLILWAVKMSENYSVPVGIWLPLKTQLNARTAIST